MRQEAETYAVQDKRRIKLIEMKNHADALFHSYKLTLKDNGDLINDDLKVEAKEKIGHLRSVFSNPAVPLEELKQQLDSFQQTLFAIGASVYKQADSRTNDFSATLDSDITSVEDLTKLPSSEEDFNYNFDEDPTVTVDYETIE